MEIKDIKRGIIIDGVVYEPQHQPNKNKSVVCWQCALHNNVCNALEDFKIAPCQMKDGVFINFRKVEINEQTDQREYNDDVNFKK